MYDELVSNEPDNSNLTEEQIWDLKYKFDKLTREWMSMGVKIKTTTPAFGLFDSYNPRDGVVYMRTYMMQENLAEESSSSGENEIADETSSTKKEMTMQDAFKKRFGENWIENKEARILLHWLLLETGRNENTETYYEFILSKTKAETLAELEKINIKESDIV